MPRPTGRTSLGRLHIDRHISRPAINLTVPRTKRYPAKLLRPSSESEAILTARQAGLPGSTAYKMAVKVAGEQRRKWVINELFDHYAIRRCDPRRWNRLAMCLAFDHVSAMRFDPERPLRTRSMHALERLLGRRKTGRPRKYTAEGLRGLLEHVIGIADRERLTGRGKQKRAVHIIASGRVPANWSAPTRRKAIASLSAILERRLSDAIKCHPEIASKLNAK